MKKRINKCLKGILTGTLALGLMLGSTMSASAATTWTPPDKADNPMSGGYIQGTYDEPADAYIKKTLRMAEGTNTPDAEFTFEFARTSAPDGVTGIPDIASVTISYKTEGQAQSKDVTNGEINMTKMSGNVLADVAKKYPAAGTYEYTVSETEATYTSVNGMEGSEAMTYSKATYKMTLTVANEIDASGVVTGNTYIKWVTVEKLTDDAGDAASGKVDPENDQEKNGFAFQNTFTRIGNTKPEDPTKPDTPWTPYDPGNPTGHAALEITKTVKHDVDISKPFDFTINLKKSATEKADVTSYNAYVVDDKGAKVSGPTTIATGKDIDFQLMYNQKLIFPDLPSGTRYTLTEKGGDYTASAAVREDGGTPGSITNTEAKKDLPIADKLVGDEQNYAYVTNDKTLTPPTGIFINNLPFIMMVIVAIGGLAAVLFLKRRKRA